MFTKETRCEIGNRIRELRIDNRLTQAEFAECVDISVNFLSEIENGKKGFSIKTLFKMCGHFKISADLILLGNKYGNYSTSHSIMTTSKNHFFSYFDIITAVDNLFIASNVISYAKGGANMFNKETRQEIGGRIRDFRIDHRLTQAEFAEGTEISINFLSEIENGKKSFSAETLYKMCQRFKISANWILFGNNEAPQPAKRLMDYAQEMSPEELDATINFLQAVKNIRDF